MRLFFLILTLVLAGIVLITLLRTPRDDRNWRANLTHAPQFLSEGAGEWRIANLRAFTFHADGTADKAWRSQTLDAANLEEIWFFVEPFETWDGVAHSLLSFVFEGDAPQTLSVSVEARREEGETYSGFRGIFNAYELIYLWSTEKDVLTRIAVGLDHEIYAYRLNVTPEQARAILDHFIARTNMLHEHPRFYNTLRSNCTNELAKAVNDAFPGALPWHFSHILTGRSAEHLHALGFIDGGNASFEDIKVTAAAGDAIRAAAAGNEFPTLWRNQQAIAKTNLEKD